MRKISKSLRAEVYNKYNGKCAYTGKELPGDWQVDHIESVSYSVNSAYYMGTPDEITQALDRINHIDNLLPALRIVNHYKRAKNLRQFRSYMMDFHKRLAKLPKNTSVDATKRRKEYMQKVADAFDITADRPFEGVFYFEKHSNH